jgi:hypothetical protein
MCCNDDTEFDGPSSELGRYLIPLMVGCGYTLCIPTHALRDLLAFLSAVGPARRQRCAGYLQK